jgi:hypothetical protein
MVEFVRQIKKQYRFAGLSMAKNRKTVFEKRIFHILDISRNLTTNRQVLVPIVIVFSIVFLGISTCTTETSISPVRELTRYTLKPLISVDLNTAAARIVSFTGGAYYREEISEEEFFDLYSGVWINPENQGTMKSPRYVIYDPTKCLVYGTSKEVFPTLTVHPVFKDFWRDAEGNVWFLSEWERMMMPRHYEVGKISVGGISLERFGAHNPLVNWVPGESFKKLAENNNPCYHFIIYKQGRPFNRLDAAKINLIQSKK